MRDKKTRDSKGVAWVQFSKYKTYRYKIILVLKMQIGLHQLWMDLN